MIREIVPADVPHVCDIYNYYIKNTIISFEETPVSFDEMEKRIDQITSMFPFYVYSEKDRILGYAYASIWKGRSAYRFSAESAIYLRNGEQGKGIGRQLYTTLLDELKHRQIHTVIGGIALPNESSRILHEKLGFKKVAHFEQVGYKFDKWIDVEYWQLILG